MKDTSLEFSLPRRVAHGVMLAAAILTTASATLAAQVPTVPDGRLTQVQLDSLVAPIALYSDPLLAQVMLAATFPDQIHSAAEYVRVHGTRDIDDQPWDVSVKAVAHYPTVVNMMDAKIDWTTSLGQAYASQSTDLMQAVQDMRSAAQAQGNLVTTPQQEVVVRDRYISIWPAQPGVMYVPVYDPAVIYVRPCYGPSFSYFFSFGIGYPIGPWLIYDWDWPGRRIYYTGWVGGGWIGRSRPFISITNVYVNDRYRNVGYNHDVFARPRGVDHVGRIRGFDGQTGFHREVATTAVERGGSARREPGFIPVANGGTPRTAVPVERGGRPLVTRNPAPPMVRSTPQASPPTSRYEPRNGGGFVPRPTERPVPQYNGGGPRGVMGGGARQPAPAPRQARPAPRQAAPRQSAPAPRGGSRPGGDAHGHRGA